MSETTTIDELRALHKQLARLETLLREYEDWSVLRNQSLHARLGDLEDVLLGQQQRHSFTGQAQVPLLGRVPLTLVRDEPA